MRFASEELVVINHNQGRTPPSIVERSTLTAEYLQGAFDSDPRLKQEVEAALTQA